MIHDLKEEDHIEITLKVKVTYVYQPGGVDVCTESGGVFTLCESDLDRSKITKIEPPLRLGRAMLRRSGSKGRVLAVHEHRAWFQYDSSGSQYICATSELCNIPEEDQ